MLESCKHRSSSFATLTYDEGRLPAYGSLVPSDMQLWLKRLRAAVYPVKVRFFGVGEYGSETWRPHYHAILFGLDRVVAGGSDGRSGVVQSSWGMGHTFVGGVSLASVQYVAGYVTKKMTGRNDERLQGRYPEFARMSLRPGIGGTAVGDIAYALESDAGLESIAEVGDVPASLRYDGKFWPIGRYIRGKVRKSLGLSEKVIKEGNARRAVEEMQRLRKEDAEAAELEGRDPVSYRVDRLIQQCLNVRSRLELSTGSRSL